MKKKNVFILASWIGNKLFRVQYLGPLALKRLESKKKRLMQHLKA